MPNTIQDLNTLTDVNQKYYLLQQPTRPAVYTQQPRGKITVTVVKRIHVNTKARESSVTNITLIAV